MITALVIIGIAAAAGVGLGIYNYRENKRYGKIIGDSVINEKGEKIYKREER